MEFASAHSKDECAIVWRTISRLWDENKQPVNRMDLLRQLDYYGKLSTQLEWRHDPGGRSARVVYNQSGLPTAALLHHDQHLVDYTLFWIACSDVQEANYLLAIINSQALYESVASLMPKGQYGARHLEKHLWKLPIPEFDAGDSLHVEVSGAGEVAAQGAAEQLAALRRERERVTVTIAPPGAARVAAGVAGGRGGGGGGRAVAGGRVKSSQASLIVTLPVRPSYVMVKFWRNVLPSRATWGCPPAARCTPLNLS